MVFKPRPLYHKRCASFERLRFALLFSQLLVYYMVTVHARFRHPLESLIAILSVYLFQSAEESWRIRWFGAA